MAYSKTTKLLTQPAQFEFVFVFAPSSLGGAVANLEAVLITAFHKAANNGESARAVIKLKELQ